MHSHGGAPLIIGMHSHYGASLIIGMPSHGGAPLIIGMHSHEGVPLIIGMHSHGGACMRITDPIRNWATLAANVEYLCVKFIVLSSQTHIYHWQQRCNLSLK